MDTPHIPAGPPRPPASPKQRLPGGDDGGAASRGAISDVIKKQVMQSLGRPNELLSVQVRPVGGDFYRVNVVVGADVGRARVADSFFLEIDGDGKILKSSPQITKLY